MNDPVKIDNRNYNYDPAESALREEYGFIVHEASHAKTVIDLGCGDGALLKMLSDSGVQKVSGVELSESGARLSREKGFDVIQGRIDAPLDHLKNDSFEIAISNVTIQMVMYPEVLIQEMKRISKKQIISFPNFGFIKNRLELLFKGRMPKWGLFGYDWYNTGHIHQLSFSDFVELCRNNGLRVRKVIPVGHRRFHSVLLARLFPNLFAKTVICITERRVDFP